MNLNAVSHRSLFSDCYGLNDREIVINIRTGKDITGVKLLFDDPYAHGIGSNVFGDCLCVAVFYGTDSANRFHALSDAYSGIALRLYLRMALGTGGGLCSPLASFLDAWYAASLSHRALHGV